MATALAASLLEFIMGLASAPPAQGPASRLSLEGLTLRPLDDGSLEVGARKIEVSSLRVFSGLLVLEVGHLVVHELVAVVRREQGAARLGALDAKAAELSGVKVHGPLDFSPPAGDEAASSWSLAPLAAADGTLRAEIVDAHLLFDADVTVPIRQGRIDFQDAAVEHVGPDSRMGVGRDGLYVDAPNGRSYLYRFPSGPVAGVEYEQRGALLGPFVTDRGALRLREFGEWLLRHPEGQPLSFTEQARLLFARTAVAGDVQLGDGRLAAPGVHAELTGRADGRNGIRLHSAAVGSGLTLDMPALSVRDAVVGWAGTPIAGDEVAGSLTLRILVDGAQVRLALDLADVKVSGLSLRPPSPHAAPA